MVRAVRQLAELNSEVHGIFGIVHVGSNLNLQEFLLGFVEDQGHGISLFQIILNDELYGIGILWDRTQRDVALLIGLLEHVLVWRNILLRQRFHLVGVVCVLFLFLLDNVPLQPAAAFLRLGRSIERSLLRFAIRAEAHLNVFLLFLLAFQTNGDLLDPGVFRKGLLVLCHGLLDFRETLLHFGILCLHGWCIECHSNQENGRDNSGPPTIRVFLMCVLSRVYLISPPLLFGRKIL